MDKQPNKPKVENTYYSDNPFMSNNNRTDLFQQSISTNSINYPFYEAKTSSNNQDTNKMHNPFIFGPFQNNINLNSIQSHLFNRIPDPVNNNAGAFNLGRSNFETSNINPLTDFSSGEQNGNDHSNRINRSLPEQMLTQKGFTFKDSNFPNKKPATLFNSMFQNDLKQGCGFSGNSFAISEVKNYHVCQLDMNNFKIDKDDVLDIYKFICEELVCCFCNDIVYKPKKCQTCDKLFCGPCIDEWKKKDTFCPYKCNKLQVIEPGRTIINILNKIELHCRLCSSVISYEQYTSHLKTCEMNEFSCKGIGCNYKNIKSEIEKHVETCELLTFSCEFCNQQILRKNKEFHKTNECPDYVINCKCKTSMKRKDLLSHSREECVNKIIAEYEVKVSNLENEIKSLKRGNTNEIVQGSKIETNMMN